MEVKVGYKKTEVGIVPEGWNVNNLAETSTLKARIGWQGLTTREYKKNGDFYLITGTDFQDGRIDWQNCHFVLKYRYDQDKNIQIKSDDILVTKDGTIGKVAFVDKMKFPATLNSGVFVVRPKNQGYFPMYAYYLFQSNYFFDFLRKLVAGSTINHLYQKDFVGFNFPLPPFPEQKAIAKVLSDTDKLIQSLEHQIEKKRHIKQGAMQKLLTPKEGRELKKIKDLAEVRSGKRLPKGSELVSVQNKHPYIRVLDMSTRGVEVSNLMYVPNEVFPKISITGNIS